MSTWGHRPVSDNATQVWEQRGYTDGAVPGRQPRTPLRDDDGAAADAYLRGFRRARRQLEERTR